ncbi:MAG TPA: hypothetical protein VNE41_10705 [Chitinophagaceae bacterium]|nr:hypothetical protein [Chitinophagaceae bacterium]
MNTLLEEFGLVIRQLQHHDDIELFKEQYNQLKEKYIELKNKEKDLKTRIALQNKLMELDDAYIAFMNRQIGRQSKRLLNFRLPIKTPHS